MRPSILLERELPALRLYASQCYLPNVQSLCKMCRKIYVDTDPLYRDGWGIRRGAVRQNVKLARTLPNNEMLLPKQVDLPN